MNEYTSIFFYGFLLLSPLLLLGFTKEMILFEGKISFLKTGFSVFLIGFILFNFLYFLIYHYLIYYSLEYMSFLLYIVLFIILYEIKDLIFRAHYISKKDWLIQFFSQCYFIFLNISLSLEINEPYYKMLFMFLGIFSGSFFILILMRGFQFKLHWNFFNSLQNGSIALLIILSIFSFLFSLIFRLLEL